MSHVCNLDENPLEVPGSGFLGIFDGAWGDKLPHTVIIYKVKSTKVRLYYGIGAYEPWNIDEPDCYKVKGKLMDDGSVSFHFSGSNADVVYRIDNEGERLYGTYTRGGNVTRGTFKRVY
jgi:hypothetical protein